METTNFEIKDSIFVNYQGELYDLHNDYDFAGYTENKNNNSVVLNWKRGSYDWVNPTQPETIKLEIDEIKEFEVNPGRTDASHMDQITLEEIAYLTDADWCDGPFTTPNPPEPTWDWVFIFESDLWLKINAKSVTAKLQP